MGEWIQKLQNYCEIRRNQKVSAHIGKILEITSLEATSTPNFTQRYKYLEQKLEYSSLIDLNTKFD